MNWLKRIGILLMVFALITVSGAVGVSAEQRVQIGDYVYFGVDESGEPILWRCVAMREEGPLLLSHYVITYKAFDANRNGVSSVPKNQDKAKDVRDCYGSNNWKNSTLRQWLNAAGQVKWGDTVPDGTHVTANPYHTQKGFLSGFTAEELALVKTVANKTAVSVADKADAGNAPHVYSLDWRLESMLENYSSAFSQTTQDRFFCLNTPEIIEVSQNLPDYEVAWPTESAQALCDPLYLDNVGATYYWLRDAYADSKYPEGVRCMYPGAHEYYYNAHNGNIGVRPAFVLSGDATFTYGRGTEKRPLSLEEEPRTAEADASRLPTPDRGTVSPVGTAGVSEMKGAHATLAIGDYITMGEMDGQPILWRCVDIDENGPLLLSDKLLRFYAFDAMGEKQNDPTGERQKYGSNRWSTSSLRYWLNSDLESWGDWPGVAEPSSGNVYYGYSPYDNTPGFLNVFSKMEQTMIKTVKQDSLLHSYDAEVATSGKEPNTMRRKIQALDNYKSAYKEQTTDKVFLLDRVQANKVYELFEDYILASPTSGAVIQSGYKNTAVSVGKTWHYWLRDAYGGDTSGEYPYFIYDVTTDGRISSDIAYSAQYGVRPCFYADMTALMVDGGDGAKDSPYTVKAHNFGEYEVLVAPSCEQVGRSQRVCADCHLLEKITLEPAGHSFEEKKTAENIFFEERIFQRCTVCGAKYDLGGTAKPALAVAFFVVLAGAGVAFYFIKRGKRRGM